jgi:hypothetical protein
MSTDGGRTWSDPIKVNQTPTNIPAGNAQTFTPSVAINSDGTVALTYYDFRNNPAAAGLPTDYWISHADSAFTNPASWSAENRLTNSSFNMENAPVAGGYFVGDYEGLAAAGTSFYALFAQAGSSSSDSSNMFFRDPPPAGTAPGVIALGEPAALESGTFEAAGLQGGAPTTPAVVSDSLTKAQSVTPIIPSAAASANSLPSATPTGAQDGGDVALDGAFTEGWEAPMSFVD